MTKTCSTCGHLIPAGATGGLCPRCAWDLALGAPDPEPDPARSDRLKAEEKPGDFIGPYQLTAELGQGGCGIVYEAEQKEPVSRRVALKIIKLGMDTRRVIARFEAERQALERMDHPNIARILDAGATSVGRPFFVLELVKGARITEYCDRHRLPLPERLALFSQVCHAVQHAHHKGIIHRDLKPSNVLVAEPGPGAAALPKVIDFGIAKMTADQPLRDQTLFTAREQFIGTPAYMSPEQASLGAVDVDARTDIYSLGVLLYELLTGSLPFNVADLQRGRIEELLRVIREEEPPRPSARLASVPAPDLARLAQRRRSDPARLAAALRGDLDWIVMKCLDKDRAQRYDSAASLDRDLQRYLRSEPVLAGPPSSTYRLRKFVRRNRLAVASATVVTLFLLAGAILLRVLLQDQWQARQQAVALASSNFSQAVRLIEAGNRGDALAYLARSLSLHLARDSDLDAFRARLITLLADYPWNVPGTVITNAANVEGAGFTPDGRRILAALGNGALQVFDADSGTPLGGPVSLGALELDPHRAWAEFNPAGTRVVTAGAENTARILDAATGRLATPALQLTARPVLARFSSDGTRVLTVDAEGVARVWNAETGEPATPPMRHGGPVRLARLSPKGDRLLTAGDDGQARLWNVQTADILATGPRHQLALQDAQFSLDGSAVVTASLDGTARVWDSETGEPRTPPFEHSGPVMCAVFSPDGRLVATGSQDATARLWNAENGAALGGPMRHNSQVVNVSFSSDGRRVATASWDNTARVWDAATALALSEPLRHENRVTAAEFSPDGRRLVTSSHDGTARIWGTLSGPAQPLYLGSTALTPLPRFSADSGRVLMVSPGGVAQLWDAAAATNSAPPLLQDSPVLGLEFRRDGKRLVTVSSEGAVREWDAETAGSAGSPLTLAGPLRFARMSADARRVLAMEANGVARIWDLEGGRPVGAPLPLPSPPRLAEFSTDNRWLLAVPTNGAVQVWAVDTGQQVARLPGQRDTFTAAHFSADGLRIVTASRDGMAVVWATASGRPLLPPLRHSDQVSSVEFSPDGSRVVTASLDYTARIWDSRSGEALTGPMLHVAGVTLARFSADGRRVATASNDGNARVWDALTGQPLSENFPHGNRVIHAEFSADSARILTVSWDGASPDGTVRIWDLAPSGTAPSWLIPLAEAVSGEVVNGRNVIEPSQMDRAANLETLRRHLDRDPSADAWAVWGRWFLADPAERTISPFSHRK